MLLLAEELLLPQLLLLHRRSTAWETAWLATSRAPWTPEAMTSPIFPCTSASFNLLRTLVTVPLFQALLAVEARELPKLFSPLQILLQLSAPPFI